MLKEKNPGLFIELNPDFSIKNEMDPGFAGDYSGMCADISAGKFWILSDEEQKVFLWDIAGGVQKEYSIPVDKPEGIAVDVRGGFFYIVSDSESKLYVFKESVPD